MLLLLYLITQWAIPCSFNNAGLTTFTLTYTQTLAPERVCSVVSSFKFRLDRVQHAVWS